jgi:hypothetical protein
MTDASTNQPATTITSDHVAPLLPATAPAPEPARKINFLKALLLYWLMPKRIGPHLAVGSFKRAWAAHVIAIVLTAAVVGAWALYANGLSIWSPHELRVKLAEMVIVAAATTVGVPSWFTWGVLIRAIVTGELALVLLAVFLMPWCAGGDSTWSVFKRSLKNVYWSTTLWVPIATLVGWWIAADVEHALWFLYLEGQWSLLLVLVVFGVPVFVLLRALLVGASRYVGPPDGPSFRPREPLCERCGYCITGLPLTGNCPECGFAVRDSLPGGRRRQNAWQLNEFRPRGLLEVVRMQWRILCDPTFFEHLPVQGQISTARHFWWVTFILILLISINASWLLTAGFSSRGRWYEGEVLAARVLSVVWATVLPFILQILTTFAACLWGQFILKIRDYRTSAAVCYYASPLMWPTVFVLFTWGLMLVALDRWAARATPFEFLGIELVAPALVAIGMLIVFVAALLFWWFRLIRALRCVRHANV